MFYRVIPLTLSLAIMSACGSSGDHSDKSLSANSVLASCKQALAAKNTQTALKDCAFAEQWLSREQPDSLPYAEALESLSDVLALTNPTVAANSYQQALSIREKQADNSLALTALQIKLANSLTGLGKWAEAEIAFKKALRRIETEKGVESAEVAEVLNWLGVAQLQQQLLADAELTLRRALSIREAKLNASDTALGETYNNLGYLYQSMGKPQDAESFFRKAVSNQESAQDTPYRQLFDSLANLASLQQTNGKPQEAEAYWKKLLVVTEKGYGKDSTQYALVLNHLGMLAIAAHRNAPAENLFKTEVDIREKKLGANHILTAEAANNLAVALANQGKTAQAEPLMRHAFAVTQVALGMNDPLTQQRWNSLQNLEKTAVHNNTSANPQPPPLAEPPQKSKR